MQEDIPSLPTKLFAALAKAQAKFPAIPKNREVEITMKSGGRYKFRYADLEAIIAATRPPLAENGLSVLQVVRNQQLVTILAHESGQMIESAMPLPDPDKTLDIKTYGAEMSYKRRYGYQAMVCVAADDDIDEDGQEIDHSRGRGNGNGQQQRTQPAASQAPETYPQADFEKNFPMWSKAIANRKKTHAEVIATIETKAPLTQKQKDAINAVTVTTQEQQA